MNSAAIREQLHRYIDVADDQHIAELRSIMDSDTVKSKFTKEELAEFNNRLAQYKSGEMASYAMEDAHNYIRQAKKDK